MTSPLFPEPDTSRTKWEGTTEPRVDLVRSVSTNDVRRIRQNLNSWFDLLPNDAKPRFSIELTSTDNDHHLQAIDELYVYSRLRRKYPKVTVEEDGTGPDFRAYDGLDELQVSAEVLTVFDNDEVTTSTATFGRLAEQLNAAFPNSSYVVQIEETRGSKTPKTEALLSWVRARLDELPVIDSNIDLAQRTYRHTFIEKTKNDGIEIDFCFIGVGEAEERREFAPIGPFRSTIEGFGGRLLPALQQKVKKRYDARDKPMLLVATLHQDFIRRYDLELAAYGRELGATGRPVNGFFSNPNQNTRFSGIYAMRGMTDYDPDGVCTFRFRNPNAKHPELEDTFSAQAECFADLKGDCGAVSWDPEPPSSHL